jgi:hypothetical protein
MTLSSPHLGQISSSSRLVNAGLWVLKKWRKSLCLQQISMTDSKDLKKTFIYQLSHRHGLNWFS